MHCTQSPNMGMRSFPGRIARCAAVTLAATCALNNTRLNGRWARSSPWGKSIGTMATIASVTSTVHAEPVVRRPMFIDSLTAKRLDEDLMGENGFSSNQLMELAGLSVASATHDFFHRHMPVDSKKSVLVICGPGNNGGDGLIAARHLKHFGYDPTVYFPVPARNNFPALTQQCKNVDISFLDQLPSLDEYAIVVDSIFGYSFKGPVREAYKPVIAAMASTKSPVVSVDVPSGWDVDRGDTHGTKFKPSAVISLTVPKLCMVDYQGAHYVGGRFVPDSIAKKYNFELPSYGNTAQQHVLLPTNGRQTEDTTAADTKWQLYVSPDGYPYYYNHATEQSEWALFQAPSNHLSEQLSVVMVTAPNMEVAKTIARSLVKEKLAACVQLQDKLTSIYEWNNVLEESSEVMLIIKTKKSLIDALTLSVKSLHPYEVPEVVSVDITGGSQDYLDWVLKSTVCDGDAGKTKPSNSK